MKKKTSTKEKKVIGVKKPLVKKTKTISMKKSPAKEKKVVNEKKITTEKKISVGARIFVGIKKTLKAAAYFLGVVLSVAILLFAYVNFPVTASKNEVKMGVTFSSIYAQQIGLDWREAYLATIEDLKIKHVRLPVYWDRVEKSEGEYDFDDIDWQLEEARKNGVEITLVVGQKVPRWPECYVPRWVGDDPSNLDATRLKEKLLAFDSVVIDRYKNNHPEVTRWQVENEPFLDFGICSKVDVSLLDAEISRVRSLDPSRPIVVTDSGELSLWVNAAKRADIFGTTMYREVYSAKMGHWRYPIGPNFFKAKQLLIKFFAKQDNAIVIELQGEPWVAGWTTDAPVETQLASMNAQILEDNIIFAKKTGMKEVFVWGVEWWYWMKIKQNNPTLWESARVFAGN